MGMLFTLAGLIHASIVKPSSGPTSKEAEAGTWKSLFAPSKLKALPTFPLANVRPLVATPGLLPVKSVPEPSARHQLTWAEGTGAQFVPPAKRRMFAVHKKTTAESASIRVGCMVERVMANLVLRSYC